ncbi:MAG: hypothetical protein IIZ54_00770 [Selenomonadaceae bacterium]|nr:hypothetical protein [Selenomonadaceae bacterium]
MRTSEEGFSCMEVLVVIAAVLLVIGSVATVGEKLLLEAVVEYETACLASDLRWAQQHNRTASGWFGRFPDNRPATTDDYWVKFRYRDYEVRGYGYQKFKGWTHVCQPMVFLGSPINIEGARFKEGGNAKNVMTIHVYSKMGTQRADRYVIIDAAGRIRVDRKPP